jgi:ligand-binding sensor domain-containing protein/two-component sensor histidine kinase
LLLCQAVNAQQHNFRNYNVENGLGQSQVYSIYQDKTGSLWLGTRGGGISVYDGFNFKTISKNEGLPNNYINVIKGDSKGVIWIGTNTGLCFYDGKRIESIDFGSLKTASVRDIFITVNDELYLATNKGIFTVEKNKAIRLPETSLLNEIKATAIWKEVSGRLWIGSDKGLFYLEGNELTVCAEQARVMRNAITTLTQDENGKLWIGTYGDGMYCYGGKEFYRIDHNHELYRETVLDIYTENTGDIWVATLRSGVIHYDVSTKTFASISEKEGLSNNHVRSIIRDNNGNLWFGTSGGGISHYLGKQFTTYDERSGLAGNFIYSVLRDSNGDLWIGNSQKGVSRFSKDGVQNFNAETGFQNVKVKALAEDKNGNIWLGTDGRGVYVYQDEQFIAIESLKRAYVKQMKCDSQGNVWIATAGSGLIKISTKNENYLIEKWLVSDGMLSNRLTSLHIDKKGRIWYGSEGTGVGCFDENRTSITLNKDNYLASNLIRSLTEDKNGRLWIGTAGGGICTYKLYDKTNYQFCLNHENGLKSDNVYLLTTDMDGNVIVGTEKGLDFVYLNKDGAQKQIKHYGKLDGFTGVETCQNSVWKDNDGSIWFGTINGLCQFNPSELNKNTIPPILAFKDIKLSYESILDNENDILQYGKQVSPLKLAHYQNHITFEFLGINLKRPSEVSYKWKLEGFDDEWSPESKDRSIMYSNLEPGKYRFLLLSSNEDGEWNKEPLVYEFEIDTPYWKTTWFKMLIALGIFVVLLLIYILTIIRIRRKAKRRQREIEIEKDLLELEQKAMRLQMNPHFIFNALNSIQSLIGTGKETEARYYLAKFSRLMRQILDNSRKTSISLQEEIETLENYLLVEQFCNGGRFEYEVQVDPSMESDFINIPPMLIQPFVENSIKHGMKERTNDQNPGKIKLSFKENGGILECIIEDDGIGRERAEELKRTSMETYHKSTGLSVTEDRLQILDPNGKINPLEIIDLYEDGIAQGTRVIIRLPIE